jgi:putative DNA methylase
MENEVRAERESKGLSLRAFAKRCRLDPAHLSRIERSLVIPTEPVMRRIATGLGYKAGEFPRLFPWAA